MQDGWSGPIAVANGTLYLLPGAAVEGEILVVGGRLIRSEQVTHFGPERVYWDAAPVIRNADGLLALRERRRALGEIATARTTFQAGRIRTTLSLGTGGTYNRIEGLPVLFGPLFEFRPNQHTQARLDLRGILRTAGADTDLSSDFGYVVRAHLRFEGKTEFGFGGRLYSEVEPIEDQPLSASESGWSAVLLQSDYRDYFEREGVTGMAYVKPARPLRFELSLSRDSERSVRATDPWSLFRNSDRWRPNPLIDDGHYFITGLQADYDTRNERDRPTTGWMIRTRYEHITSDDIAPVALPPVVRPAPNRRRIPHRPPFDRRTPVFPAHARTAGQCPGPRRWLADGRPPAGATPSIAGWHRSASRLRLSRVYLRTSRYSDPALPALCDRSIMTRLEVRTRVRLNLGLSDA